MATTSTSMIVAKEIKELCIRWGWKYEVRGSILTITKRIVAGDNDSFCVADMEYGSILGCCFCHEFWHIQNEQVWWQQTSSECLSEDLTEIQRPSSIY